MLTSHIATLAYYLVPAAVASAVASPASVSPSGPASGPVPRNAMAYADPAYQPLVNAIARRLQNSVDILENDPVAAIAATAPVATATQAAAASPAGAPPPGREELRILNDKVNALMDQRKAELARSVTAYTSARKQLSELKPVADQFNFIAKISTDIERLSRSIRVERDQL
jgi:hypothetical protein